ncbi:MAG: hypothetical protein RQ748_06630 [Elusimicrobiales bacterium]|nr:hypothetical protein [Elusimicrobiales bacterium]
MNKKTICFFILVSGFSFGCASSRPQLARIADEIHSAERKHDIATINTLAASISTVDLAPKRMTKYSDEELRLLYSALRKAAFYSPDDEEYVARQELVFNEKLRRGKAEEEDVERMVSAFLSARMFERARTLKSRYPKMELPDIPETITGNAPQSALWQAYAVSNGGKTIELKALPLSSGSKIVVVISPGCGAMESAMKSILSDPELAPFFRTNGTMITRRSDFAGAEDVGEQFGFPEVYVVHKSQDFPGLWLQSSPYLYFLKDGKILYSLRGWSDENNSAHPKKEIRKGLTLIGLM